MTIHHRDVLRLAAIALAAPALLACESESRSSTHVPSTSDRVSAVRTSTLIPGPERATAVVVENPYADDPRAMEEGRRYYLWMNCHGCHGARGGGGIGPPFADAEWIYGSEPENIFQSIVQGRPNGMPTYEGMIPEDRVWMIAAYVRSLGPPDPEAEGPSGPTQQQGGGNTGSPQEVGGGG